MVDDKSLYALPSDAYWTDTGTPALYLKAHTDLLSGSRGVPHPNAKEIRPGAWAVGTASLSGEIVDNSFVGDAAVIGRGARVSGSCIGGGAHVAPGAQVVDSVLLPGASVRDGATVIGSIVGEAAVIGEGASVTALSVVGGKAVVDAGAVLEGARHPSP